MHSWSRTLWQWKNEVLKYSLEFITCCLNINNSSLIWASSDKVENLNWSHNDKSSANTYVSGVDVKTVMYDDGVCFFLAGWKIIFIILDSVENPSRNCHLQNKSLYSVKQLHMCLGAIKWEENVQVTFCYLHLKKILSSPSVFSWIVLKLWFDMTLLLSVFQLI